MRIKQTPQREPEDPRVTQLQKIHNRLMELKDEIWFTEHNINNYDRYKTGARYLAAMSKLKGPVPTPEQLQKKLLLKIEQAANLERMYTEAAARLKGARPGEHG
jgi:hypothetical protein